jgi:hypothetical protein
MIILMWTKVFKSGSFMFPDFFQNSNKYKNENTFPPHNPHGNNSNNTNEYTW